jgi:hypothetical protein
MKITVCWSLFFADKILEIEKTLKELWHEVIIPLDTNSFLDWQVNDWWLNPELGRRWMMEHYNNIKESEAILVCNFDKNGIQWYIGWATLIEMWIACHRNKKIFLLNDIPSENEIRYVQEIKLMLPIMINNQFNLIK